MVSKEFGGVVGVVGLSRGGATASEGRTKAGVAWQWSQLSCGASKLAHLLFFFPLEGLPRQSETEMERLGLRSLCSALRENR